MSDSAAAAHQPVIVDFTWHDPARGAVTLVCRFALNGIRHMVEGHFRNQSEPWGRLLPGSLVSRLAAQADQGRGWTPSAEDFQAVAGGIIAAMRASCSRPLLCTCAELPLTNIKGGRRQPFPNARLIMKALFVLQSGAQVIVAIDRRCDRSSLALTGCFTTCYFPIRAGWRSPRRAYADVVEAFVKTSARHFHRTGARILPDPPDSRAVTHEGYEVERGGVELITPETWGFRPVDDGILVFHEVPRWS